MQVAPLLRVLAVLPTVTELHSQTGKGTSGTLRSRTEMTEQSLFSRSTGASRHLKGSHSWKGHQDAGCRLWPVAWVLHFQGRKRFLTQPGLQPRGTELTLYCAWHTSLGNDITSVCVHTLVGTLRKSFIWESKVTLGDSQLGSISITAHVQCKHYQPPESETREESTGGEGAGRESSHYDTLHDRWKLTRILLLWRVLFILL